MQQFNNNLFHHLYHLNLGQSFVFSPLSIKLAFANLLNGAEDITQAEICNTLGLSTTNQDSINNYFAEIVNKLEQNNYSEVHIANSLWLNSRYQFSRNFIETSQRYFNSESYRLSSADPINLWCSEKTRGKINHIINNSDIVLNGAVHTLLVLLNAIYFKSTWAEEFNKNFTKLEDFQLESGQKLQKYFMVLDRDLDYFESQTCQLVRLYYKDPRYSCFILLPKYDATFDYKEYEQQVRPHQVHLELPRFEMDYQIELNDVLKMMGIIKAFKTDNTDFNSMIDNLLEEARIYISKVIHKAYVKLDEEGTEAAAVTAVLMMMSGCSMGPYVELNRVNMYVNKPFHWWINDSVTDQTLFMGYNSNPKQI